FQNLELEFASSFEVRISSFVPYLVSGCSFPLLAITSPRHPAQCERVRLNESCGMDPERTSSSESELTIRRERIRRGLIRANTAALMALLIVVALSLAAIRQAFQAEHNAQEAGQAQRNAELRMQQARAAEARALLEQTRAQRRTGEAGQRFGSLAAASEAAALAPSVELRHEVVAALALPDVSFVPVWTNQSGNFVPQISPAFDALAVGISGGRINILYINDSKALQRETSYLLPPA